MTVAGRPARRTVDVKLESGDFAGWTATALADFPAKVLADLTSGDIGRIIVALDRIVVSHNMPDSSGELAASLGDVDPYRGMLAVAAEIARTIGTLPNR